MKVHVRRVQTGVAAASTLLVATGAGTIGCAEDAPEAEGYGVTDEALNPGSAQLELQLGNPGSLGVQLTSSTTDEFVRVGETLKLALPAWILWDTLYPDQSMPDDARVKQLSATVKVSFLDKTTTLSAKTLSIASWSGTMYGLYAYTNQLVVPAKTDTIEMSLTIKDAADTSASITIGQAQMSAVPVFGGDLPNKSLLFDNTTGGALRQRVVDGDLLVKGSTVTIGYTDWRADQIVDKTNLNTQIGTATVSSRFGQMEAPIYGKLTYVVSYGVSFDGGQTFQPEKTLAADTSSRLFSLLGANRTDYESTETIPTGAPNLQLYAHVKAYLLADYTPYPNVTQKMYADNEQVLLKDAYDNPNGAFSNYTFQLQ
jgi:hypothetical protein